MADEKDMEVSESVDGVQPSSSEPEEAATPPEEASDPANDNMPDTPGATPSADEILAEAGAAEAELQPQSAVVNEGDASEGDAEAAMLAMLEELPQDSGGASPDDIDFDSASVSKVEFQHLSEPAGKPEVQNIDMLLDVNLPVSIELGRTRLSIADILALGPGSVVELNKLAGEPVDLLVNYKVVARGEVVVIDENFGVRVTNLISPTERLKALGEEQ